MEWSGSTWSRSGVEWNAVGRSGVERSGAVEGELCFIQADIEEDPLDTALDILEALREKFSPAEVMAAIDAAGLRDATHTQLEQHALTFVNLLDKALDAYSTFEESAFSVQAILTHEKGHMLQHLLQTATWKAKQGQRALG